MASIDAGIEQANGHCLLRRPLDQPVNSAFDPMVLVVAALSTREKRSVVTAEAQFCDCIRACNNSGHSGAICINVYDFALHETKAALAQSRFRCICLCFEIVHPIWPAPAFPPN